MKRDSSIRPKKSPQLLAKELLNTRLQDIHYVAKKQLGVKRIEGLFPEKSATEILSEDYEEYQSFSGAFNKYISNPIDFENITTKDFIGHLGRDMSLPTSSIEGLRWVKDKPVINAVDQGFKDSYNITTAEFIKFAIELDDLAKTGKIPENLDVGIRIFAQEAQATRKYVGRAAPTRLEDVDDHLVTKKFLDVMVARVTGGTVPPYLSSELLAAYDAAPAHSPEKLAVGKAIRRLIKENEKPPNSAYPEAATEVKNINDMTSTRAVVAKFILNKLEEIKQAIEQSRNLKKGPGGEDSSLGR